MFPPVSATVATLGPSPSRLPSTDTAGGGIGVRIGSLTPSIPRVGLSNDTIDVSPMRLTAHHPSKLRPGLLGAPVMAALLLGIFASVSLAQEAGAPLEIVTERTLPKAVLSANYDVKLAAKGGVPPRTWEVIAGALPPGLTLEPVSGTIFGVPTALGLFRFAVEVTDSDDPADTRTREFTVAVISALVVEWKSSPVVTQDGIAGSVKLANQTANDVELTMIVVAVNETGKAFVLGYQQFTFAAQSTVPEIAFGSGLPRGSYVVHVDAIAEVPEANAIYRARLQTLEPLETH